jgi:hypothetical protein
MKKRMTAITVSSQVATHLKYALSDRVIAEKVMNGEIVLHQDVMKFMQMGVASPHIQSLLKGGDDEDDLHTSGNMRLAKLGAMMVQYVQPGYNTVYITDTIKKPSSTLQRYDLTKRVESLASGVYRTSRATSSRATGNELMETYKEKFKHSTGLPWNNFFGNKPHRHVGYGGCFARIIDLAELGSTDAIVMDTWLTAPNIDAFDAMYFIASLLRGEDAVYKESSNDNIYTQVKDYAQSARTMTWREVLLTDLTGDARNVIFPVMMAIVAAHTPVLKDALFVHNLNVMQEWTE